MARMTSDFARAAQHRQSSDRHHHRPTDTLEDSKTRQFQQIRADGTQQRGDGENGDGGQEDRPDAPALGQPAGQWDQHSKRQQVRGDGDSDVHGGDAQ